MNIKYFFFGLIFYMYYQNNQCNSESITFISTERPLIYWYSKSNFKNITLLSRRLNRQDPRHYVQLFIEVIIKLDNKLNVDFYFYQFLTNRYRPSFVEMHFKFCDMMNSDTFFGQTMKDAVGGRPCPYPPGAYHLKNMSIPYVPKGFPFTKGRIYCNLSYTEGGVTREVGSGSIDMEVKVAKIKRTKK